jgi:hypothetical protein
VDVGVGVVDAVAVFFKVNIDTDFAFVLLVTSKIGCGDASVDARPQRLLKEVCASLKFAWFCDARCSLAVGAWVGEWWVVVVVVVVVVVGGVRVGVVAAASVVGGGWWVVGGGWWVVVVVSEWVSEWVVVVSCGEWWRWRWRRQWVIVVVVGPVSASILRHANVFRASC